MPGFIDFFRVGNADMTLITLASGYTILLDCYLVDEKTDLVAATVDHLYARLPKDNNDRPYVDAFLETHPDEDHCHGAASYLHLGKPENYVEKAQGGAKKKVFIREMWSSPLVYRRRSEDHKLTPDAVAINSEAKRRVEVFRSSKAKSLSEMADGNRIRIFGEDYKKDGVDRLDGVEAIRVNIDESFVITDINGTPQLTVTVRAPLPVGTPEDEAALTKNSSSVVIQLGFHFSGRTHPLWYALFGGDAEVEIWRRLYRRHKNDLRALGHHLLLAPHHCSWSVLSEEKASATAKVDAEARTALAENYDGYVVSSCKKIIDDNDNPPAHRAKREYVDEILDGAGDRFYCTGEPAVGEEDNRLTFDITGAGPKPPSRKAPASSSAGAAGALASTPRSHG